MPKTPNLRQLEVTQSMGKDWRQGKQVSGMATSTPGQSATNSTKESVVAGPPKQNLGGKTPK